MMITVSGIYNEQEFENLLNKNFMNLQQSNKRIEDNKLLPQN